MKAVININGVIGQDTSLLDVIRQFKSYKKPTEVEVLIDSPGGSVDEGVSIFNYLRKLGLPITTKSNKAYSIAASIFMAGDTRLLEEGSNRMMIHMPWGEVSGGSDTFEAAAQQLRKIENELTEFYSTYSEVDEASVRRLLKNETFMTASEAVDMGLATGTYSPMKAVAFYNDNNNQEQEKEGIMTKAEKLIQAFASFLKGSEEKEEITPMALVLQDANGEEIEFPELDENENPEKGAKIMKAGEPVDGEILMPDGSKIIAVNGTVESVEEAPVEEEVPAVEEPVAAVEEPAVEEEEEEMDYLKLIEELEKKILEKVSAQFQEKEEKLNLEILALKKEVGSEIDNDPTPQPSKSTATSGNFLTNALKNRRK